MLGKGFSTIHAFRSLLYGLVCLNVVCGSPQPLTLAQTIDSSATHDQPSSNDSAREYGDLVKTMRKDAGLAEPEPAAMKPNSNSPVPDEKKYPGITIINGTEGMPFPDPSQVILEPLPTLEPLPMETEIPEPSPTPWTKPGRCQTNQTVRIERAPEASDSEILYDRLFIDQDLVPSDTQEVFGTRAELYPYGGEDEGGALVRMELYEVPCVPYRIRMTRRSLFYDSGLYALRNYDKNYAGKGELHPVIQQKLFGKSSPSQRRGMKRN